MIRCVFSFLAMLMALVAALPARAGSAPAPSGGPAAYMTGINLSGGENVPERIPGVFGTDYRYPTGAEAEYYSRKGFNTMRMPFRWERLQPMLEAPLDGTELARIDAAVKEFTSRGMSVILDPHNYGQRIIDGAKRVIGVDPQVTNAHFADFWERLAGHYKGNRLVVFGLMNEPYQASPTEWAATAQAALNAVRAAGASNLVLVPGTKWSGAHSWISSGNGAALLGIKDTADNMAFEVHQYLDHDYSGSHSTVVVGSGSKVLVAATEWARSHQKRLFLGEFGWENNPANTLAKAEYDALLNYIQLNKDVWRGWAYWAGGPWFQGNWFNVGPIDVTKPVDLPQMSVLMNYL